MILSFRLSRLIRGAALVLLNLLYCSLFCFPLIAQENSASVSNNIVPRDNATHAIGDLANRAAGENLPYVSAALLRTQIQQEQDLEKRKDLTRRLVMLLVVERRFDEALAISSTMDSKNDPILTYWNAEALLGSGEAAAAAKLFQSLHQEKPLISGVSADQITLCLARSLRGGGKEEEALRVLGEIPLDSPWTEDVVLEKASDLLALGRTEEGLKLLQEFSPTSDEGRALAAYLKALARWRSGNYEVAQKLFMTVPASTAWSRAASTLGGALCYAASGKTQQGVELLEKHLDAVDADPLLEDQFRLLEQLYTASSAPDSIMLKKWSENAARPARARMAAFYQAKEELRLHHAEAGESLLDAFIRKYPDDPLADQAMVLLSSSRLQRGLIEDARGWANDRVSASPQIRARLAYLRGLSAAASGKNAEAKEAFQMAATLDPKLAQNALFNKIVLIATTDRGSLDTSEAAKSMVELHAGLPSEEMEFQIALDLVRRDQASGIALLGHLADQTSNSTLKARAQLAAAEWNMKSGKGDAANRDLARAVHENSGEPEREEYLNIFLKDTGKKSDAPSVISAARAFLQAHPDSRFIPEVRLKLAEELLASGDIQGARVAFEQIAFSGAGTEIGRRALFLAAQSAARAMDPASMDDSLMLLERVAEHGSSDQLVWQARLQQGALKNAQNLPQEALAIYGKILSARGSPDAPGPDAELRAATMMAMADTQHQLGAQDPAQDHEAIKTWQQLAADPAMPLRWRNQALCKSGLILEKLGEEDAALAAYYQAFKNPRTTEPEQLWHDKAAFEAARLLERRKQWSDAVTLFGQIVSEGGARASEAKARIAKLRLENFLWEN
jgi:tetratricopeptide (TPR) repeat protein